MTSPLRHAATIILLRQESTSPAGDFAVFMVKRHAQSGFMANAYVYPGGRLDDDDSSPALAGRTTGLDDEACQTRLEEPETPPERARALFLAGIRESFEEAGVLLAYRASDPERAFIDTSDARFDAARKALHDGQRSLLDLAEQEDLHFPLEGLYPFAHWITPVVEPKRYDTRFLVAVAPTHQSLSHDDKETVDSAWLRPKEALDRYQQGDMQLAPPTLCTLEELNALGTLAAVLASCEERAIPAIMPHLAEQQGVFTLLLPNHPEHPEHSGATDTTQPTHVVLDQGRWWSRSPASGS